MSILNICKKHFADYAEQHGQEKNREETKRRNSVLPRIDSQCIAKAIVSALVIGFFFIYWMDELFNVLSEMSMDIEGPTHRYCLVICAAAILIGILVRDPVPKIKEVMKTVCEILFGK